MYVCQVSLKAEYIYLFIYLYSGLQFGDSFGIDAWNISTGTYQPFLPFSRYGKLLQMEASDHVTIINYVSLSCNAIKVEFIYLLSIYSFLKFLLLFQSPLMSGYVLLCPVFRCQRMVSRWHCSSHFVTLT